MTRISNRQATDKNEAIPSKEEVRAWTSHLRADSADVRADAAFALGAASSNRGDAVAALRSALRDTDAVVVNFAAQSLGQLADVESLRAIVALLGKEPPRQQRGLAWAIAALAARGTEDDRLLARRALEAYRRRSRGSARVHADAVIERLEAQSGSL